jgi:hypothetical protein
MSLKGKEFDAFIKGRIQDLPVQDSTGDWDLFEKVLDHEDGLKNAEDKDFDAFIRTSSEKWQAPYNRNHWKLMSAQLQIIESRKRTVIESKLMEVTAVLFFAFTLFSIPGFMLRHPVPSKHGFKAAQHIITRPLPIAAGVAVKSPASDKASTEKLFVQNVSVMPTSDMPGIAANNNDFQAGQENAEALNEGAHVEAELPVIGNATNGYTDINATVAEHQSLVSSIQNKEEVTFLEGVRSHPLSELALIFPWKYAQRRAPATYYLSAYASADVNLINTPFDKLYSFASYTREALNNSYGIHISGKSGDVEVETGIGYASRRYQPEIITEAFGQFGSHYFEKSLRKISFDMASLPATIKYHFIDQPSWSAYLIGNVSLNLIMNATYDIQEILVQGRPAPGRYTPDEARLDEKPFTEGLINGGKLSENYFITVGFGFGIQKRILKGVSMYLQPSYNRQILSSDIGIGPNKDKIHTSGIQIGIKTPIAR